MTICPTSPLAILCGGRSTRFGSDKGLFRPDGKESLVARACRHLGPGHSEILIVVKDRAQAAAYSAELLPPKSKLSIRIVTDTMARRGSPRAAMSGVITALKLARSETVAIVAVDQIGLRRRHLEVLAQCATGSLPLAARANTGRTPSNEEPRPSAAYWNRNEKSFLPFPSLWRRDALKPLLRLARAGKLSVRQALSDLAAYPIPLRGCSRALTANANRRQDLARSS